jgi:hypothetical protein
MKNPLKTMMAIGVVLVFLLTSAPVLMAKNHDITSEIKGEGAITSEERIELPPMFLAMKNLSADERAIHKPLTESELATIEGRLSINIPIISIHVAPAIDVAVLTQLNFCTLCFGTNQVTAGAINQ